VLSEEGSIETIESSVEPSVSDDLQASAPLDEMLDPLPAAQ
jgi:hypothetical protein